MNRREALQALAALVAGGAATLALGGPKVLARARIGQIGRAHV